MAPAAPVISTQSVSGLIMTALFLLRYVCMDTAHGKASVRFHHVKPKGVRMTPPTYQIPIGREWQSADSGAHFETHNPYTGAPWALIPRCTEADIGRAVTAAKAAFDGGAWPAMTATQRGALLRKLGDLILAQAEQLAQTEVWDNGKLIAEMLGQTRYVPRWYYYYGGPADKIEGGVLPIDKTGVFNFTRWEPLGVRCGDRPLEFAVWVNTYRTVSFMSPLPVSFMLLPLRRLQKERSRPREREGRHL
jgi:hypothetical protein